jgi:hypothetical protein
MVFFCLPGKCPPGCTPVAGPYDLNRVDPVMIDRLATKPHTWREAAEALVRIPSILKDAVIRKIRAQM